MNRKRKFLGLPNLKWWLTWESATSSLVGSNFNPEEGNDMNSTKSPNKDSSVSMDPSIPGTKVLEDNDLAPELAEPVAAAAKVDDAVNNKAPADQLIMAAIREAMFRNGKMIEGRVSILPGEGGNVEVVLHLPNVKPATQGVFKLV